MCAMRTISPENSVLSPASGGFFGITGSILPAFWRKSCKLSAPLSFQIAPKRSPHPKNVDKKVEIKQSDESVSARNCLPAKAYRDPQAKAFEARAAPLSCNLALARSAGFICGTFQNNL